jgi:general secretion pathway protein A
MYIRYFGLKEPPFSIAPDPRYLYLSQRHEEALAHLIYGVTEGGGFVQLTGDVGTGKTMLIRALLERLPNNVDIALVLYPILSVREFISAICDELRIDYAKANATLKSLIDTLNVFLLENHAKGRRTVLIIDEAQNLSREVLEQVRLLTNLETNKEKLLQILLVGQPELNNMLMQDDLRQLAQRITARYSLMSLFPHETSDYILHRCRVAGTTNQLFTRAAMRSVHRLSSGIPRIINMICDRALLGAYAGGKMYANSSVVRRGAAQVGIVPPRGALLRPGFTAAAAVAAALLIGWQVIPVLKPWYQDSSTTVSAQQVEPSVEETQIQTAALPPDTILPAADGKPDQVSTPQVDETPMAGEAKQTGADQEQMPALAELLADPNIVTNTETALVGLFAYWGEDYSKLKGATACTRAVQAGLQCILQSGTWNNLRHLNRPAVIELVDDNGRKHHVLVSALEGSYVLSQINGQQYRFDMSEMDQYWYGQYLLLWKPPLPDRHILRLGMRGQSVVWLRQTLARYQDEPISGRTKNVFDKELEEQVKAFQREHHLTEDGIVGRLTFLQLNTYDSLAPRPLLRKDARAGTS